MLGSPPPPPMPRPVDPNNYYIWKGFSTGPGNGGYGDSYVSDLNNNVFFGAPGGGQPNIYPPMEMGRNYDPFRGVNKPFMSVPNRPSATPPGIWQQGRSFAPFKDLETAQRYQQERAYRDWEQLPEPGSGYGAQAPSYPTNPNMRYTPKRREELSKEDQARSFQIDLKNYIIRELFGKGRANPKFKDRPNGSGLDPSTQSSPESKTRRAIQKRM